MDREIAMRDAWAKDVGAVFWRPQSAPVHPANDVPLTHPGYCIRPHCIGAAWQRSFEFTTALTSVDAIETALFSELPLGMAWKDAALNRVGEHRWRFSRKQEG